MKKFLQKILFFMALLALVLVVGLLLPPTPKARMSLLTSKPLKDSLLQHTAWPRLLIIAGSSTGFALDSQMLKDSLHRNPINTGIHGGLGLYYMLDDALPFVQKGDVILIAPEYHQFFGTFADGNEELLRVFADNNLLWQNLHTLRPNQVKALLPLVPKYALQKFLPGQYKTNDVVDFYTKDIFNAYGDAVYHWQLPQPENPIVFGPLTGDFNYDVLRAVKDFSDKAQSKGATVYLGFPAYQKVSYDASVPQIARYEKELHTLGLPVLGRPAEFIMTPEFIFDTPYHLNKKGAQRRTALLLQHLKKAMARDGIR